MAQKVSDYTGARKGGSDALPPFGATDKYAEYMSLLFNAVNIKERDIDLPEYKQDYIKKQLFEVGRIAFEPISGEWYKVSPYGLKKLYDKQDGATLFTTNGKSFTKRLAYEPGEDGAYVFTALPYNGITFGAIIRDVTGLIAACDVGIRQNLEAIKTPYIAVCQDEDTLLSLRHAIQDKQDGQAALVISGELGDAVKGISIETPYVVDKLMSARDMARDELLNKLGVLTANTQKRERVQSAEVNAKLGECTDYIYMFIDHFNRQSEAFGLPFSAEYNGSMESLYEDEDDAPINGQKEQQTEGAENGLEGN